MLNIYVIQKIFRTECLAVFRNKANFFNNIIFFILVSTLWVLSVPVEVINVDKLGPSIIWVSLLLVIYLNLDKLFRADYLDGTLVQWNLSLGSLRIYVLSKLLVHWCISIVPLILVSPVLGLMFHFTLKSLVILMGSLVLAAWTLIALGSMVVTLTIRLDSSSLLVAIILLPLYVPILLLGTSATLASNSTELLSAYFSLLLALAILSGLISPFIAASGLKTALY